MAELTDVSGIAANNIVSVCGIAAADIATINGLDFPVGAMLPTWSYGESRYFVSAGATIIPRWSYGKSEVIHDNTT